MKQVRNTLVLLLAITSFTAAFAQTQKTDSIKVYGNCGMCKNRIEKALNVTGIFKADWDADTKIITVTYDAVKISNDELQRKIAAVGHDTEKYSAEDEVYKKLPGCCKYERKGKSSGSHAEHKH